MASELDALFNTLDKDGNGFVDLAELQTHLKSLPASGSLSAAAIKNLADELLKKVDKNSDGKISRDEFRNINQTALGKLK